MVAGGGVLPEVLMAINLHGRNLLLFDSLLRASETVNT